MNFSTTASHTVRWIFCDKYSEDNIDDIGLLVDDCRVINILSSLLVIEVLSDSAKLGLIFY